MHLARFPRGAAQGWLPGRRDRRAGSPAPQGIRVVAVSPAWTWSPALASMANNQRAQADAVGAITHPLGRVGDGAEVANVVCFLASTQASWITGVDIPVDGGFSVLGPDQGKGPKYWFQKANTDDLQATD